MPDRRPLPSLRSGTYDDPPASPEASTPQTRRQRLRRAILGTNELAQEVIHMTNPERQGRRSTVGGLTRRRQRSSSEQDDQSTSTPEGEGYRRRRSNKRRRLNAGVEAPTRKAIKYGHYGQVELGRLKLALVSCDGGEHVDARHPETSLGPENLLRHDKSVYCSERPQSNIVLKHADDTPFCLEKLHIVGPEIGFTAPVRAGVVYVAMTMAELQKYLDPSDNDIPPHARRSRYSPYHRQQQRQREVRSGRSSPELLTIAEALRDPYINAAYESHDHDDVRDSDADMDTYCDSNPATDPNTWLHDTATNTFVRRTQPVTILSDDDAGPEESSPQEVLDYRFQRERMMRRRYDIENWHRSREPGVERGYSVETGHQQREREREAIATLPLSRLLARQRDREQDRTRGSPSSSDDNDSLPALEPITPPPQPRSEHRRETASDSAVYCQLTGLPLTGSTSARSTNNAGPANPPDRTAAEPSNPVTIAPFRLARGKFNCAIAFDPPVSGRFVLLKLWAAKRGHGEDGWERERERNVDVQAIVAKGWMGGMRFFPAVQRR